eukprot:RCo002935
MDWLRSWVTTPEQRCSELVQKILQTEQLSESEWSTLYTDLQSPTIPATLLAGLPSLLEALQTHTPPRLVTICHLLSAMAKAASVPAHATVLVQNEAVSVVWAAWKKGAAPEIGVEVLAALRNLVLVPPGAEALMAVEGGTALSRLFSELSGASLGKVEARIHLLAALANLVATHEFAAFQIAQKTDSLTTLAQRFQGNCNRFAIAVAYNLMCWPNCAQMVRGKATELLKGPLVKALGELVLSPCEGKSMEYELASRIIATLDATPAPGDENPSLTPVKLVWTGQPIFQT